MDRRLCIPSISLRNNETAPESRPAKMPRITARRDVHKNVMCMKYGLLWISKEFSDVTIECSGHEEKIQAHKLILMVQSPVFAAMFTSGLQESKTNTIKIQDFSKATLEALLSFMYTGHLDPEAVSDKAKMKNLLQAADKYQVDELKLIIFSSLVNRMTVSTVGEVAVFAGDYNAPDSVKFRIQHFLHQNWKELSKDATFQAMNKTHGMVFSQITYGDFD